MKTIFHFASIIIATALMAVGSAHAEDAKISVKAVTLIGASIDASGTYPLVFQITEGNPAIKAGCRVLAEIVPLKKTLRHDASLKNLSCVSGQVVVDAPISGFVLDDDGAPGLRHSHFPEYQGDSTMYAPGHAVTLVVTSAPPKM